jgi:ornithine cyclodeaminase
LNAEEVRQALPMAEAIAGMKTAFAQLSAGQATVPLRSRIETPAYQGVALFMPAYLHESEDLAIKVVSVFPQNAKRGRPIISGVVLVLDPQTGEPLAMLEGSSLTAIRTGAGAGAATDILARPDAAVAAIIGSGVQARTQLEAVCTVRPIREARIYSPTRPHAAAFAESVAGQGPIPANIHVVDDPEAAVAGADIICAATTSATPVFNGRALKPGAHVNGVGSYTPTMQEVDAATIQRALVVVDSRAAALAEAGDLIIPLNSGMIQESHIYAELGEIVSGRKPGRTNPQQITYFKSVGVAVQDASAARIAYQKAISLHLGTEVVL